MRQVVAAGTDAACLCLFDPKALPEDFDSRIRGDPISLLQQLRATGQAYLIDTSADGSYLLHAYVNEEIPAALRSFADVPVVVEEFLSPSGELYFAGAECAFRENDAFLRKHPHMGGLIRVPQGIYRLTLHHMDSPEEMEEGLLQAQVSQLAFWLHQNMGWFVLLALLSLLGLLLVLAKAPRGFWFWSSLPLLGLLVHSPVIVSRLQLYQRASESYRNICRECPSFVAKLEIKRSA